MIQGRLGAAGAANMRGEWGTRRGARVERRWTVVESRRGCRMGSQSRVREADYSAMDARADRGLSVWGDDKGAMQREGASENSYTLHTRVTTAAAIREQAAAKTMPTRR